MTTAIIGNGWVGKAMKALFPNSYILTRNIGEIEKVNKYDAVFICVPTPLKGTMLDTSVVEQYIQEFKCKLFVVRSTVNPGDCDKWTALYSKNIVFQPEFIGETPNHPLLDPKARQWLIIGGTPENRRSLINLYTTVYNANITIRQVSNYEAEVIKLTENRAIAFKVAQCQELYDACEAAGVDFYTIRDAVYGDDPRFNLWWTFIMEKRGFDSKCLPKDVFAWCAWAESVGYEPKITKSILNKNKEWILL